ncbi:MAG: hypothetical protein WBY53_18860 [Acidobacteriaceae bacterium]
MTNQTSPNQPPNHSSDLLPRYLQAIGEHLPASNREDVLAELRANLQAQLDDRAEEINRPLTDADIAPILQQHGRPFIVAARYLPQQYLIGPALFPYYLMILRKASPFVLLACFLAHASTFVFSHSFTDLIRGFFLSLGQLLPDFILFLFWLTAGFVIAEYVLNQNGAKLSTLSWNPFKLPSLKPPYKGKSRATRIADLVFHIFWFFYVLEIPTHPFLILGPGELYLHLLSAKFAPIWHTFYIALLVVLVLQIIPKIFALNPTYDHWRVPFDLFTKLAGLGVTAILLSTRTYFISTNPAASQVMLTQVNYWINFSCRLVIIISLIGFLVEAWKHYAPNFRTSRLAL